MSVEKLIAVLQAEGAERERKTLADAKATAETIVAEARLRVATMAAEREEEERRRATLDQRVNEARTVLTDRRREQLLQQTALDTLRKGARERWRSFMESDAYRAYVHRRWAKAAALLDKVGEVRADPVTARALGGTGAPAARIDPAIDDGFVALSSDGGVEVHDRFAVRLARLWEREGERYVVPLVEGIAHVI